jgi:hypothetical protein
LFAEPTGRDRFGLTPELAAAETLARFTGSAAGFPEATRTDFAFAAAGLDFAAAGLDFAAAGLDFAAAGLALAAAGFALA